MTLIRDPWGDGYKDAGCPPKDVQPRLPPFPPTFEGDCKFIYWSPHGFKKRLQLKIHDFQPVLKRCGVYTGDLDLSDPVSKKTLAQGKLEFDYTRNFYETSATTPPSNYPKTFRFVVKGDLIQTASDPKFNKLITCGKTSTADEGYEKIFVYGGFDVTLYPLVITHVAPSMTFRFSIGHQDGQYTHDQKCSSRPIPNNAAGSTKGHYDGGFLLVSPGNNFTFDPKTLPIFDRGEVDGVRKVWTRCESKNRVKSVTLQLTQKPDIHSYETLDILTKCKTRYVSTENGGGLACMKSRWAGITSFDMGYWKYPEGKIFLHLLEGNLLQLDALPPPDFGRPKPLKGNNLYVYGFGTSLISGPKLVDLASNEKKIGEPATTELVFYLF